jgi:hypothetical protein
VGVKTIVTEVNELCEIIASVDGAIIDTGCPGIRSWDATSVRVVYEREMHGEWRMYRVTVFGKSSFLNFDVGGIPSNPQFDWLSVFVQQHKPLAVVPGVHKIRDYHNG